MPELTGPEQQATEYASKITSWEEVNIQGDLADGPANVTHSALVTLSGKQEAVEFLKVDSEGVFMWAGNIDISNKQDYLEDGYLVIEDRIFMPLASAFEHENYWMWR